MRVFISSTCFDLIDLRAELKAFFHQAGVEPVMSDSLDSEFQVKPDRNSIETCLTNVRDCDEFLIILSKRYGPSLEKAGYEDISATHLEYREAVKNKMPIRMFVRDRLEADYTIWKNNGKNSSIQLSWCKEPNDRKTFELLEEHRELNSKSNQNNWLWLYSDSIQLKQRLAVEYKELFARAAIDRLVESGRVPFFEITGSLKSSNALHINFELQIRNMSNAVALLPLFEIKITVNKWNIKSLAAFEATSLPIQWAYHASIIELPTRLTYSILAGQTFVDDGVIKIGYNVQSRSPEKVTYELEARRYAGVKKPMLIA
jgi:hypothetical protein